jgi:phosphate starvation-inducible protein PhoH
VTKYKKKPALKTGNFEMDELVPKTANQRRVADAYRGGKNVIIHGLAGTGKTFLACHLGVHEVLVGNGPEKIVIYRSAVPTRDMGFMPGNAAEKQEPYETPYKYVFAEIMRRGDAYDVLKKHGHLEFSTSSYLRGLTIRDSVIVVDECQSWTWHEIDSIMTRVGKGTRIVICGDHRQDDLVEGKSGFKRLLEVASDMSEFEIIEMNRDDIVRSDFVKSYILAKERCKLS